VDIQHYLTFVADQRLSMQIYADNCCNALAQTGVPIRQYHPQSKLEKFSKSAMIMRGLRYLAYPYQVRQQVADVHHVLDHGYAHLASHLSNGKKVVTVHDLIPYLCWKGHLKTAQHFRKPLLNLYSLRSLSEFDAIITPSEQTKQDLVKHLEIDEKKIHSVPPGLASHFKHHDEKRVKAFKQSYQLDQNARLIMISGREFYKNHTVCLHVLKQLLNRSSDPICLIKTGLDSPEFNQQVQELGLQNSVRCLFLQDFNELPILYNAVDCLLFPSLYEGFGMPVVEALACGTPVVTSNAGSLPEVAGDLAVQCSVDDVLQLTDAVWQALNEPQIKQRVVRDGNAWVAPFRVGAMGKRLLQIYQSIS